MPGARHFWPLIWATHAHSSNPLALRIPRAPYALGCCGRGSSGNWPPGTKGRESRLGLSRLLPRS